MIRLHSNIIIVGGKEFLSDEVTLATIGTLMHTFVLLLYRPCFVVV